MNILSISTSSSICSVAILEDNNCILELNINNQKTHSEKLMPLIDELLKKVTKTISDINLIAVDIGPGSFTGIRIGIASVKAIAFAKNIPVIGVSSLQALAYFVKENSKICSIIDARNNQIYAGVFDSTHNLMGNYLADDICNLLPIFKKYNDIIFVGNGLNIHRELLSQNSTSWKFYDKDISHLAKTIGICAYSEFKKGNVQNADTILPLYLRKSQAERMKEIE